MTEGMIENKQLPRICLVIYIVGCIGGTISST